MTRPPTRIVTGPASPGRPGHGDPDGDAPGHDRPGQQDPGSAPVADRDVDVADRNLVSLTGRVSGAPERRVLPSGDEVVRLRVVVRRDEGAPDTVPVQVGPAPGPGGRVRAGLVGRRKLARAERLVAGSRVEVHGQLRRRWWEAGGARRSRLEVVAREVREVDP